MIVTIPYLRRANSHSHNFLSGSKKCATDEKIHDSVQNQPAFSSICEGNTSFFAHNIKTDY